jgi:2-polyprenyl-6-methoxyphenol hydroxylase-like FAD-dependent oxidoreductase
VEADVLPSEPVADRTALSPSAEVLVVGAGPTGLVLALWLARCGIRVRVIDKKLVPGEASRAIVVQARTLEFYRQLGIVDDVLADGIQLEVMHLRRRGRDVARLPFREFGAGFTPYPYLFVYPQDDHERLLVGKLRAAGVEVEWGTELVAFTQSADGVSVTLTRAGAREETTCAYLCGCDGAHSSVRHALGLSFEGGAYDEVFYVADVRVSESSLRDGYVNLAASGFALMLPVRSSGMQRLIGVIPREFAGRTDLTFDELRDYAEQLLHVRVDEVNWFSTYKVHHRVAGKFQVGRCFLSGDAAHVHSPAGGQGMNTGIGDAINLAWKLAAVLHGRAAAPLIDTYEPERRPFALTLVKSTDRAFTLIAGHGLAGKLFRTCVMPVLIPGFVRFEYVRFLLFRLVSQIRIQYRGRPLSTGQTGDVHSGDRLPWVPTADGDNFAPLASRDWQVHVYGEVAVPLREATDKLGLPVHQFAWSDRAGQVGLVRDALYLVRPDGHIALASETQEPARLTEYIARHGLSFA